MRLVIVYVFVATVQPTIEHRIPMTREACEATKRALDSEISDSVLWRGDDRFILQDGVTLERIYIECRAR